MSDKEDWLNIKQAAGYCSVTPETLRRRRRAGRPPVYHVRTGTIAYRRAELDVWLAGTPVLPTKES